MSVKLACALSLAVSAMSLGCSASTNGTPNAGNNASYVFPQCYSLSYSDPVGSASARLFPVWIAILPGNRPGLIGKPSPELPDRDWKAMTKYVGWKPIADDSLELMFGGNFESINMHVIRTGSHLDGRATWISDAIEPGPKPSMRVIGKGEQCPPHIV